MININYARFLRYLNQQFLEYAKNLLIRHFIPRQTNFMFLRIWSTMRH